jgi:hypothetical protein
MIVSVCFRSSSLNLHESGNYLLKRNQVLFFIVLFYLSPPVYAAQVQTTLQDLGAVKITLEKPFHYKIGNAVSGIGDFNADGFLDVAVGAPDYSSGGLGVGDQSGAVFIVYGGQLDRESGTVDLSSNDFRGVIVTGHFDSKIGNAIARVGDVNVDGFADLAFGSSHYKEGYILFGRPDMRRLLPLSELNNHGIHVKNTGFSVASAGDFNGDGFPDVVFGNPYSEKVSVNDKDHFIGRVSIVYGQKDMQGNIDALKPGDTHLSIRGTGGALVGSSLDGGFDMNQDGFSDIILVNPGGGKDFDGRGVLIQGGQNLGDNVKYSFIINHARHYARYAKDVNGDGHPDLIIGKDSSSFLVLWGGDYVTGTIDLDDKIDPRWGVLVKGAYSAYGVGDLNGDGFGDLAIALPNQNVNGKPLAGCVIFLLGQEEWPEIIDVARLLSGDLKSMHYVIVSGNEAYQVLGTSIAGIGDLQGDGFDDVIIGAPAVKLPGETTADHPGAAYVIQGKSIYYTQQGRQSLFHPSLSLSPEKQTVR